MAGPEDELGDTMIITSGRSQRHVGSIADRVLKAQQIANQARAAGVNVKIGQFPFVASGRARAMEASGGFAKIVADTTKMWGPVAEKAKVERQ